jgi:molybdate transport system regulatory protein
MTYAEPQHYHVKVRVYNESIDFGKGVAELLQRIEATGSLSAAYKAMGMSASKAWKILRRAEADLGFALVSSTAEGRLLLERYTAFNAEVQSAAAQAFAKYFK